MSKKEGNVEKIDGILSPKTEELKHPKSKDLSPKSQRVTNDLADWLVSKFKAPEFRPLFLKAAWRLDRGTIERHVAAAFELGTHPRAYFISLVKQEKAYYIGSKERSERGGQ